MKIFLDTNIFYNDWYMKNANFKYLFHFINNEYNSLILSKLVIQEVENIRKRETNASISDLKKTLQTLYKLTNKSSTLDIGELDDGDYNLLSLLKERIENIEVLDYSSILHTEVVERALNNKKPFTDGEKGYRDTLIWLSLLDYLKSNNITEEVIFITANSSDFYRVKKKDISFHDDLLSDITEKEISVSIQPYRSLYDFADSTIDKDMHAINHDESLDIFIEFLEDEGTSHLETMKSIDLISYLEETVIDGIASFSIIETDIDMFEGIEDEHISLTKELSNAKNGPNGPPIAF